MRFLESDEDSTIVFYGGDPLLNPKPIAELMERLDARYVIQTNGLLIERLKPKY